MTSGSDLRAQLHLTSAESERLRQASYYKQSASRPGHSSRAGSAVGNFEDAGKTPSHGDGKAGIGSDAASETSLEATTQG